MKVTVTIGVRIFIGIAFILSLLGGGITSISAASSINIVTFSTPYTQNFDTLAISGSSSTVPGGWDFSESGDSDKVDGLYNTGTGSNNAGDTYSFGADSSSERALGGLLSGSLNPTIGAIFTNNTGGTITNLAISYTGEQWRLGVTPRSTPDRLDFQYSLDATSLTSGTWMDVNSLDFSAPIISGTIGALNGNDSANRVAISGTISTLSIANGAYFWIRWQDSNAGGADDGLAIDDFSLSATGTTGDTAPTIASTTPDDASIDVAIDSSIDITFSEAVDVTGTWFSIFCFGSGDHTAAVSVGPTTFTLDPGSDFANSETCTVTVIAANVTDQDTDDPPDAMAADHVFSFTTAAAVTEPPDIIINEVDSDTPSDDVREFVELYDGGVGNTALDGLVVVFFNGNGDVSYATFDLDGYSTDANGYFILGNAAISPNITFNGNSLQNGADAVAIYFANAVDFPTGTAVTTANLIDALVYDTDDSDDTGLLVLLNAGQPQLNENCAADKDNHSNQRCPNGSGGVRNTSTFAQYVPTPGKGNLCRVIPSVIINEVDADNTSTDTQEFVELYDGGVGNATLDGVVVVFYNGSNNLSYAAFDLDGYSTDANGFFVLGNVGVTPAPALTFANNSLQNGQDAIAVFFADAVDFPTGTAVITTNLIDAIVYDTGQDDDAALLVLLNPGQPQVDENANSAGTTQSNQRCPNGGGGARNTSTYALWAPTPGSVNECAASLTCGATYTPIHDVQGNGPNSPLVGNVVEVEGVVVGAFQNNDDTDNGNLNGFHLQAVESSYDADPATSEGVFIYAPGTIDISTGDGLRVRGTISEFNGMTEITASQVRRCSSGNSIPTSYLSLPVSSVDNFEPYEGMLVTMGQRLVISEYFNYDSFGEIVLTSTRHTTPTALYEPGSAEAAKAAQDYLLDRITLDDGRTEENPDPAIHPNGLEFTLSNLFRGGDRVREVTGVLDYSFGLYRIHPTTGARYESVNPRPIIPPEVGGSVKVVSMNVLNYFVTLNSRGANSVEEFTRQRDKTIAAIIAMNPDIAGLVEIENHPTDAALADLVSGLNAVAGAGTYAYIETGVIGGDEIKVALIYKPATVSPMGKFEILDSSDDARFIDTLNRPVLAQTFIATATGGVFTVAVNHLKSKGTECPGDADLGDGQGNCNLTRVAATQAEVDWLATDPTGSKDTDFMIIGDLNSYDKEDPIDAILAGADDTPGTDDDFVDMLFSYQGENAYSYVFDGQIGYLDYAASKSLAAQITGVSSWHVNADEPNLIDYDMTDKKDAQDALYAADPFRYSDHDPILIGLNLLKTAGAKAKEAAKQKEGAAGETETPTTLPDTGFAPGRVTALPQQAVEYSELGDLWLEIPALGVQTAITGVPITNGSWDVTWLGDKAGWLEGSAFPTAPGNAVLTGHVWDALNRPGVFEKLADLRYGDQVIVHNAGKAYIYEVRERLQISSDSVNQLLKHKDRSWVTLVTCRGFDEDSGEYLSRVLVRAVLVEVK